MNPMMILDEIHSKVKKIRYERNSLKPDMLQEACTDIESLLADLRLFINDTDRASSELRAMNNALRHVVKNKAASS